MAIDKYSAAAHSSVKKLGLLVVEKDDDKLLDPDV
jgi:hypothetical protein